MKINNFNIIGSTEFRFKNQINAYHAFANWICSFSKKNSYKLNDKEFKIWANKQGYHYSENDKRNRFKQILTISENLYKIIKWKNGKYVLNFKQETYINDILNNLIDTTSTNDKRKNYFSTTLAFKEMLNFMFKNPKKNNAKQLFLCFAVYENGDNFSELYEQNILEKISLKSVSEKNPIDYLIKNNCYLQNSNKCLKNTKKFCESLIKYKNNELDSFDFVAYTQIKNSFFTNLNKKNYYTYWKVKKYFDSLSLYEIAKNMCKSRIYKLLCKEYFDLFNRVLYGLNLCDRGSSKVDKYLNINLKFFDGKYYTLNRKKNKEIIPPYTEDEINKMLIKIQNSDFSFVSNDFHLVDKPLPLIAEYITNIKFFYLYKKLKNIEIEDFKINTQLDTEFYPSWYATGGNSDMYLKTNNSGIIFETTYHNNILSIQKNEFQPCKNHLENVAKGKNKKIFVLIQKFNSHPKIIKCFKDEGEKIIGEGYKFKTYSFENLSKLNSLDEILNL